MANYPVRYQLSVRDGINRKASVLSYLSLPEATTTTALVAGINAYRDLYAAISGAQVMSSEVKILSQQTPSAAPGAFADSRVSEVGVFDFLTGASIMHFGQQTPGFLDSKLGADHEPDNADTDVAAWIAQFTGGTFTNAEQQALTSFAYSFLGRRKRNRSRR